MATPMRASFEKRTSRLPPALVTDLPVLALLVICWLLVPVAWAHLTAGLILIGWIGVHLWTRRRRLGRLFWPNPPVLSARRVARRFGYGLFLAAVAAMTVTGLLRWAGVAPQYVWHGGVSYFLLSIVVVHLWSIRRPLRARLRSHGASTQSNPRPTREQPTLR
jgi:hypothetical protein